MTASTLRPPAGRPANAPAAWDHMSWRARQQWLARQRREAPAPERQTRGYAWDMTEWEAWLTPETATTVRNGGITSIPGHERPRPPEVTLHLVLALADRPTDEVCALLDRGPEAIASSLTKAGRDDLAAPFTALRQARMAAARAAHKGGDK